MLLISHVAVFVSIAFDHKGSFYIPETLFSTFQVIKDHDGNVTISQRARVCHKDQTADTMPDITPAYPVTIPVVGAVLNLAPNGK